MAGEPPKGSEDISNEEVDATPAGGAAEDNAPPQADAAQSDEQAPGISSQDDLQPTPSESGEQSPDDPAAAPDVSDPLPAEAAESASLGSQETPLDDVSALMEAAIAAEKAAGPSAPPAVAEAAPTDSVPLELPDFKGGEAIQGAQPIGILNDVFLNVKIELGRSSMYIEEVLRLAEGSVVELDKLAGDPVDILVNERLIARGEVLVLNDNFCVRISEILTPAAEELAASQDI